MKLLILAAMDKELSLLLDLLENPKKKEIENLTVYEGIIEGREVAIGKCGIGKVNAAINTYRLIEYFRPKLLLNSGVAGGAGIPIGTVLVADKVAYSDVWCGPGTEYGQADGFPLFLLPDAKVARIAKELGNGIDTGLICSSDKFISTADEIFFIRSKFPEVKAVDMESGAIAQTCFMTSTPFAIVRVVSDTPGEGENIQQYKNFWKEAPEKTFTTIKKIIERIN